MKYLFFLFLFSTVSYAQDQIVVDGGLGVFNSGKKSLSETKMASLGLQEDLWNCVKDRFTGGVWLDNAGNGRKSSGFASAQVGFEVNNNGIVGSIFTGPAFINQTDALLGGNFQFMENFNLGIQDQNSNYIGVYYRHISDAGLTPINIGRDFMGLEIRF